VTGTVLILFNGRFYRPAGCRAPLHGENYVSKDGKVKSFDPLAPPSGDRLIVRSLTVIESNMGYTLSSEQARFTTFAPLESKEKQS
jgi:hypothetical protein